MSNLTFAEIADDEIFSDFNSNVTSISEQTSFYHSHILMTVLYVIAEIIKFLISLGTIGACIFLIVVILKYERLKTKTNIFFLHYAIGCLIDMLFFPTFILISEAVHSHLSILRCITYTGSTVTCVLIFVFGTAVMLCWFLQTFNTNLIQNVQRFQLYFTVALYLFCLIKFIVSISECFTKIYLVSDFVLVVPVYVVTLIITIIINIITYKNGLNEAQRRTSYQLVVSTFIILSYLPLFVCIVLIAFVDSLMSNSVLEPIFVFIYYSSEILAYGGPIVVVFLLGKKNKYFKAAYNKAFKKSVRSYDEDDFEEDPDHGHGEIEHCSQIPANGIINNPAYALSV